MSVHTTDHILVTLSCCKKPGLPKQGGSKVDKVNRFNRSARCADWEDFLGRGFFIFQDNCCQNKSSMFSSPNLFFQNKYLEFSKLNYLNFLEFLKFIESQKMIQNISKLNENKKEPPKLKFCIDEILREPLKPKQVSVLVSKTCKSSSSDPKSPKKYKCSLCCKSFDRRWLLHGHIRTHSKLLCKILK